MGLNNVFTRTAAKRKYKLLPDGDKSKAVIKLETEIKKKSTAKNKRFKKKVKKAGKKLLSSRIVIR